MVKLFEGMDRQDTDIEFRLESEESDKDTIPNMDELDEISTDLIQENFDTIRHENGQIGRAHV